MSIILGIDPGSRVTGYGVIRQNGRHLEYLGSGAIRTQVEDLPSRLKRIYAGVTEIITQFQPDMFAIEQVFMAKNADSALKLGQARGTAIVAAVNQDLPVFEYAARLVKQTVVGIGSADKLQVQDMVTRSCQISHRLMRQMHWPLQLLMLTRYNTLCILQVQLKQQKHMKK